MLARHAASEVKRSHEFEDVHRVFVPRHVYKIEVNLCSISPGESSRVFAARDRPQCSVRNLCIGNFWRARCHGSAGLFFHEAATGNRNLGICRRRHLIRVKLIDSLRTKGEKNT